MTLDLAEIKAAAEAARYETHLRYIRDMAKALRDRPEPSKVSNQWLINGITFVLGEDVSEWEQSATEEDS